MKVVLAYAVALAMPMAVQAVEDARVQSLCKPVSLASSSCPALQQIDGVDVHPLYVVETDASSESVTVALRQVFFSDSFYEKPDGTSDAHLDWIATFGAQSDDDGDGQPPCDDFGTVPVNGKFGEQTLSCDPRTNTARLQVYLIDHRLPSLAEDAAAAAATDNLATHIPESCDTGDFGTIPNRCAMVYEIPCGCDMNDAMKEEIERRLDAYVAGTKPTDMPTSGPTFGPTGQPTSAPTESAAPTTSPAPTAPEPPECDGLVTIPQDFSGELPFCYDGRGYGGAGRGRKAYTTCYTMHNDEFCGHTSFYIEGYSDMDMLRCGDVWLWFRRCVDSYGCTFVPTNAEFKYGRPARRVVDRSFRNEYEFRITGNGVRGTFKWVCDTMEQAQGMKDFADTVYGQGSSSRPNLFETDPAYCRSEAPTDTSSPTTSPAPSLPTSPSCKDDLGYFYEYGKYNWRDNWQKRYKPDGKWGEYELTVDRHCRYMIERRNREDTRKTFEYPIDWIKYMADVWQGSYVEGNGTLVGLNGMPHKDIVKEVCHNDASLWCVTLKQGEGVANGDIVFAFADWKQRNRFFSVLRAFPQKIWMTFDSVNKCGRSPLCYDKKGYATCYSTWNSENCAGFDFMIAGDPDKEGMVWTDSYDFMLECQDSLRGCAPPAAWEKRKFGYGNPMSSAYEKNGNYYVKLWGSGVSGFIESDCDSMEDAEHMRDFNAMMKDGGFFRQRHKECTAVPTQAPTACSDGFLTEPPINIGIVIDISYSTFNYTFDGYYSSESSENEDSASFVPDLNDDGRSNTILDAEIAAVIQMLKVIANSDELDNSNVNIGVVVFETSAFYKEKFLLAGKYDPLNEDGDINDQLLTDLKSIKTPNNGWDAFYDNEGYTNFDDALDKAIEYFEERESDLGDEYSEWTNLMVFLSDGVPNIRGDGDDEGWCETTKVDCSTAHPNLPDDASTKDWETGQLSFCLSGDTNCHSLPFKHCAHGSECEGDEVVKMFDSEFKRLDELHVERLAVGVGASSDVSVDSALYRIDSNPYKESLDLPPKQVFTNNDLANTLRNLCFENTANPTDRPSVSPTDVPSTTPTSVPTSSPTSSPTSAPTQSPTHDFCEYHTIDFESKANGDLTTTEYVMPGSWQAYGLYITANSRAKNIKHARYYTDPEQPELGKTIIVQDPSTSQPAMDPMGGDIDITLAMVHDKHIKIKIFGATTGFAITKVLPPEDETKEEGPRTVEYFGSDGSPTEISVTVEGLYKVIVSFDTFGGISELNVCRNPDSTPSPIGFNAGGGTEEPTASPSVTPNDCPPDVILLRTAGGTAYDSLPIEVTSHDTSTVTFKLKQTFLESSQYVYTSYKADDFGIECVMTESTEVTKDEEITAYCVEATHISIVDVFVSDPSLNAQLDTATIPPCCHKPDTDTNPVVHYTFEVKCEPCPTDTARRVLSDETPAAADSATATSVKASTTFHGDHFCKPEQFPCGDADNMVHVCHYSSKHGYKTFCVPDVDSDIVAYYPKDSCGPCDEKIAVAV